MPPPPDHQCMTILLCDPRVAEMAVEESGEPLVALSHELGHPTVRVRSGLSQRLWWAARMLPDGLHLWVVEGHRSRASQEATISWYAGQLRRQYPRLSAGELEVLTSRFVSPADVAPHVAGAAVDLTLVNDAGGELDLGTEVDATPEMSGGACYFDAPGLSRAARRNRDVLARALRGAGFVNYPTEWWHWSYGDRYWALLTGAPAAIYGPVEAVTGQLVGAVQGASR